MLYKGQRMIRFLYGWNKKGKDFEVNVGDKVIVSAKDNKPLTGEVYAIGTKYLELQVEPTIKYRPNTEGRVSSTRVMKIAIDNIEKIALYPKESQRYGEIYLR